MMAPSPVLSTITLFTIAAYIQKVFTMCQDLYYMVAFMTSLKYKHVKAENMPL